MKSPLIQFVVALFVLALAICGYIAWYSTVMGMQTSIASVENQINVKLSTETRMAETRSALAQISSNESVVQSYFVPQSGVVNFIDMLESLGSAQGTNVTIASVSTSGAAAEPLLAISTTITGNFAAVMRTVGAIEYVPYDLSVSSLALTLNASNSWTANLGVVVGLASASTTVSMPSTSTSTVQSTSTTTTAAPPISTSTAPTDVRSI